jgi:hypothetical protein
MTTVSTCIPERHTCNSHSTARIAYNPILGGIDGATHGLGLARPNVKGGIIRILEADCAAPKWDIWGADEPWEADAPAGSKMPLRSARVIIDAIVHCIDRTSCRQAVHDPDAMHALLEQDAQ